MTKQKPKFRRSGAHNYSKLGVRRKKKQVYRKSKGRDNKIRLNRAGRLRKVKVGFRSEKKTRDLVNGMKRIRVFNLEDIKTIKDGEIGVLAKVGNKKKKEIAEYAQKNNIRLFNLNPSRFLEKIELELKKKKESKSERDKKAKEKVEKDKKEDRKKDAEKKKDEGKEETIEKKVETDNVKPDGEGQASKPEQTSEKSEDDVSSKDVEVNSKVKENKEDKENESKQ